MKRSSFGPGCLGLRSQVSKLRHAMHEASISPSVRRSPSSSPSSHTRSNLKYDDCRPRHQQCHPTHEPLRGQKSGSQDQIQPCERNEKRTRIALAPFPRRPLRAYNSPYTLHRLQDGAPKHSFKRDPTRSFRLKCESPLETAPTDTNEQARSIALCTR